MKDLTVDLCIDERPFDFRFVSFLHQDDPYPGGHHYILTIRGLGVLALVSKLKPGQYGAMDNFSSNRIFDEVEWGLPRKEVRSYEFFLNTVDSVEASDDELVITGICSPVVRGRNAGEGGATT